MQYTDGGSYNGDAQESTMNPMSAATGATREKKAIYSSGIDASEKDVIGSHLPQVAHTQPNSIHDSINGKP